MFSLHCGVIKFDLKKAAPVTPIEKWLNFTALDELDEPKGVCGSINLRVKSTAKTNFTLFTGVSCIFHSKNDLIFVHKQHTNLCLQFDLATVEISTKLASKRIGHLAIGLRGGDSQPLRCASVNTG